MTHRLARARSRTLPALVLAGALVSACGQEAMEPRESDLVNVQGPPGSLVIVPDVFCPISNHCGVITAGDSIHFIAYQVADDGTARELQSPAWRVADTLIATVSREGWVRGRAPGQVQLSVSRGPASADTALTVAPARIVAVRVTAESGSVPVQGSTQLTATLIDVLGRELPADEVAWFVHNPTVASVDDQGMFHGIADGHVIVSAFGPGNSGGWISLRVGTGVPAASGLALADASVGGQHACGVGPQGEAYCWGWNYFGQLGQGYFSGQDETFGTPLPVRIKGPVLTVSAGSFHTCALLTDGQAFCWGSNDNGRGGYGSIGGATPSPMPVEGGAGYLSISAGGDHTCAIRADGAALCWGANYVGQLGNGSAGDVGAPTPVAGTVDFAILLAGLWHTCGLDADGAAYCWGDNSMGQIGNGKMAGGAGRNVPTAVRTQARFTALETSGAASHTCGLTAAGEAFCWGRNDSGQLGDGTAEHRTRPVGVNTALRFTALATGSHHTCGLSADGEAHCWGNNDEGQLGDNTLASRTLPEPVATALRFVSLAATNNTTCGRTSAGETYCWGANASAALGAGFTGRGTLSAAPLPVAQP